MDRIPDDKPSSNKRINEF
jgi:hypothetical protein